MSPSMRLSPDLVTLMTPCSGEASSVYGTGYRIVMSVLAEKYGSNSCTTVPSPSPSSIVAMNVPPVALSARIKCAAARLLPKASALRGGVGGGSGPLASRPRAALVAAKIITARGVVNNQPSGSVHAHAHAHAHVKTSSLRVLLAVVRATAGASRMRASLLVLTATLACAHGKRGGVRQRNRRADAVEAATAAEAVEAATAADAGEVVDPLGYYRYRWQEPTDTCGTELHADYDGTRAWNWGLARRRVDMYAAHRGAGLRVGGC